jgi:predicted Fe-Mo cluster-binding NifX family protein
MSCYFRHLNSIFNEAGIKVTPANRRQVDQAIHQIVEIDYKDCPAAWKKLKQDVIRDEKKRREFIQELRSAISS